MADLHMFTNDYEFVIAENIDDAKTILVELHQSPDEFEPKDWYVMPPDRDYLYTDDGGITRLKTVAEWIETVGRGFFAADES